MGAIILTAILTGCAGLLIGWLAATLRAEKARSQLQEQLVALQKEGESAREKLSWAETAERQLREAFQALAAKTLQANAETFLSQAQGQFDSILKQFRGDWSTQHEQFSNLVLPVEKNLKALDEQVRQLEQRREGAYKSLEQHLGELKTAHRELRDETGHLRTALTTSSRARGQWGELQLRRIVEMAGMVSHVDFDEQEQAGGMRPDMLVRLPNKGILPVDAKTSMQDFLAAMETDDEQVRKQRIKAHAAAMRNHVRTLSNKAYWSQFERTPEVVVMFVPNEACLSAGFEADPELIEYGLQQQVLVATPVTLFGLLRAIAYGWQQQAVAENAQAIALEGKELCERLAVFMEHLRKAGKGLDGAVRSFNDAVGSAESRLMPSARRLRELEATTRAPEAPQPVERQARLPSSEA